MPAFLLMHDADACTFAHADARNLSHADACTFACADARNLAHANACNIAHADARYIAHADTLKLLSLLLNSAFLTSKRRSGAPKIWDPRFTSLRHSHS
ncbi:hypothetical protein BDR06DRAFT_957080 [Suillus hirtellus]|nr:hypothetical protein BDR06DRAFT_957080 [Suillus hirtellus]